MRQADKDNNYDTAMAKLEQLVQQAGEWKAALLERKAKAAAPPEPEAEPEIPDPIEFSINSTHIPDKCPRKSVDGAVMKVHYVGKLLKKDGKPGKAFASSFHTGSQPLRFVLGTDDVIGAWNMGLQDMCEGERRRLMVPWDMGYGKEGTNGVPPYSNLQYDFELTELSVPKMKKDGGKKKKKEEL